MDDLVALPDREGTPAAKLPAKRPRPRKAASVD